MKFHRICIENIRCLRILTLRSVLRLPTVSCHIIDAYSRLHVIHENIKTHTLSCVFHRKTLHLYALRHKIISFIYWSHPIKHMMIRLPHIISHLIFKREHTANIHITCSRNQILLIRILSGKLKSDQMTSVVQISPIYIVIFDGMPTAWSHLSDFPAFFSRHQFRTNVSICHPAAPQCIKITVKFKGICPLFIFITELRIIIG